MSQILGIMPLTYPRTKSGLGLAIRALRAGW